MLDTPPITELPSLAGLRVGLGSVLENDGLVDCTSLAAVLIAQSGSLGIVLEAMKLLAILIAPFAAFAFIIHTLERLTQTRMAERFGWKSVLWTGWLGTPIHELSHALMCPVFRHRVDDIALFEPDRVSGRLGYVRHSFTPGNWYQELGNFFIGIAPLIGGSIVLTVLLWLFYPSAIAAAFEASRSDEVHSKPIEHMFQVVTSCFGEMLASANFFTARFWVFCYFVLCVGSHMAPSPSDYRGASRGVLLVAAGLIAFVFVLAFLGTDSETMINGMIHLLGPLFAVLSFAVVLCSGIAVAVWGMTSFFPKRYSIG